MTQMNREASNVSHGEKREYEAPAIEQTASFERLALMCGRQPGDIGLGGPCDPDDGGSANS